MKTTEAKMPSLTPEPTVPPTGGPAARRSWRHLHGGGADLLERFGLVGLLAIVIIVFSIAVPSTYATGGNWRSIATSNSALGVAALALVVPLITGRFDVSVGGVLGFTAIATAAAMGKYGLPLSVAIAVGVGVGALIGLFNGVMVAYFGVNSIIATLGATTVLGGLVTAYTQGVPISTGLSPTLTNLSVARILGVPELFVIMVIVAVATWYLLTQTPFGRYLAAVGSNQRSAQLTGLPVKRLVMLSFVASGTLAGIAGVMQVAVQGNGDPTVASITTIVPALAATFLGATTWQPGRYNVPGTILALFFIGATISGLVLIGAASWVTDVFNGLAVIVAVAIAAQFRSRRAGVMEPGE